MDERRDLPGSDLAAVGLRDLADGRESIEALLVASFALRLARLGIPVPARGLEIPEPEHRLYALLASQNARSAHSRYNALVRRMVSFARSAACAS